MIGWPGRLVEQQAGDGIFRIVDEAIRLLVRLGKGKAQADAIDRGTNDSFLIRIWGSATCPDTWTEATPTYIYANGSTSANIAGGSIVIH